jgi:hypothetical protein
MSMKTPKEEVRTLLDRLPDDVSMDSLVAEIDFLASLQRSTEDIERGDVYTPEEVRRRLNKWLESSGQERLSGT